MANFKVVFRAESRGGEVPTRWEAGCPLLIQAVQVSRNTGTGQCYLQVKLWNLTAQTVGRFTLQAGVNYTDGTSEVVEISPLDADILPRGVCRPDPVPLTGRDIASVEARILAATYGGTCWYSSKEAEPLPCGAIVNLSEDALAERQRILDDLGKAPSKYARGLIEGDGWWICSCGAPNVGRGTCCSCELPKTTLEQLEDEKSLAKKAAQRKKKKRRGIAVVITAAIVIATLLVAAPLISPSLNYQQAMSYFESGDYWRSYLEFEDLGSFSDAKNMKAESALALAREKFNDLDYENARSWYEKANQPELFEVEGRATADEKRSEGRLATAASMYEAVGDHDEANALLYEYITVDYDGDYSEYVASYLKQLSKEEYQNTAALLDAYREKWKGKHPEVLE